MTLPEYFEHRLPIFNQFGLSQVNAPKVRLYLETLLRANEELNLISRKMTIEELVDNHVIDCLLPLAHFPKNVSRVADFGSGGGLPAMIYAIEFADVQFQLFEKSPKKREFLESCRTFAPNIEVMAEIPASRPGQLKGVDLVTARAFKPIDVILEMSRAYFDAGGKYFLLKGRRDKIDEELEIAMRKAKRLNARRIPLTSPVLDVERNLVLL